MDDLALAQACVNGDEQAWALFIRRYRNKLFAAALAMTKDSCLAGELCDSLWAELFGTRVEGSGRRVCKLAAYTGRGSLEGWLRALLAQSYVNRYREQRRFVALEDVVQVEARTERISAESRLDVALEQAMNELSSEQRLILAAHYLDGRSLAETGKLLNVHESTVSRRLAKATQFLRKRTKHNLRKGGLSMSEAEEVITGGVSDMSLELRKQLMPKNAL